MTPPNQSPSLRMHHMGTGWYQRLRGHSHLWALKGRIIWVWQRFKKKKNSLGWSKMFSWKGSEAVNWDWGGRLWEFSPGLREVTWLEKEVFTDSAFSFSDSQLSISEQSKPPPGRAEGISACVCLCVCVFSVTNDHNNSLKKDRELELNEQRYFFPNLYFHGMSGS